MIEKVEDTLNGGFGGLYYEVVDADCYDIKKVAFNSDRPFSVDVIFDLGANVGIFTRYIRSIFPNAWIISVEPHPENFEYLRKFTPKHEKQIFVNKAVGSGVMYRNIGAVNGSGESYVSLGIGFDRNEMHAEESAIPSITLPELILNYCHSCQNYMIKMDIEGGEHAVFSDPQSMKILAEAEFFCAELHLYASTGGKRYDEVVDLMGKTISTFMRTHYCRMDNMHFNALRKL